MIFNPENPDSERGGAYGKKNFEKNVEKGLQEISQEAFTQEGVKEDFEKTL